MSYTDDRNYYDDHRVRAGNRRDRLQNINTKNMTAVVELDEDEETVEVPIKFEVCPTCEGKGSHVNPSIDAGGLTAEDFYEDPDFAEEYMNGTYDVSCYGCKGERVVPVIDEDKADPEVLKQLRAMIEADQEFERISRAERRMGA